MTVLFISFCLIMLGIFLFLAQLGHREAQPRTVRSTENPYEVQLKKIVDDLS